MPEMRAHRVSGACLRACQRAGVVACLALAGPLQAAPAAGGPAAGAGTFRMGTVEFSPCEIGRLRSGGLAGTIAQCASFEVPENHDDPSGRRIALRIALLRSEAEPAEADVVTFLDGGPGQAATEDWPAVSGAFGRLRKRHHVLLVDQRGTGGSNPLRCDSGEREQGQALERAVRQCLSTLAGHASVAFYATTDAVRDLEAVRLALGIPRFDLVGVSYGTRVAQQYAKAHPDAVRSIVLDSPVPAAHVLMSEHAMNLEAAVRETFSHCARQPQCPERLGEPYRALRELHADLQAHPREVAFPDPRTARTVHRHLGADELGLVVRLYAYNAGSRALLPYLVHEARAGNAAPLLANATMVEDSLGGLAQNGTALSASVACTEDADLMHEDPAQADTLLGLQFFRFAREVCALWPHRDRPADFHEPLHGALPTLVLSGEFDPVTPPRYGRQIVHELTNARQLIFPGQGHSVMETGCAPRLVAEFVERLRPGEIDESCLQVLGETPFVLDANGAAP